EVLMSICIIDSLRGSACASAAKDVIQREKHDQRSTAAKLIDLVCAIFNHIKVLMAKSARRLFAGDFPTPLAAGEKVEYSKDSLPWKSQSSSGLYLFIHGLRGHPTDWARYVQRVPGGFTIFVPRIFKKGNVSLEEAASPLLEVVRDYLKEHPGKPIQIIGTSNGSRIATYIENHLSCEELGESSLRIASVAGVLKGTKLINFLERFHLTPLAGLNNMLKEEFKWKSKVAIELKDSWKTKQKEWDEQGKDVKHLFCATRQDELVWPIRSSIFASGASEALIYSGQTHTSIVERACDDVCNWLSSKTDNFKQVKRGVYE
ncbi:MAG: hypothetical protein KDK50_04270, partial [Chlamydiia bacterium]|nr:hypothetical protein [Chlamydiia bacterium]